MCKIFHVKKRIHYFFQALKSKKINKSNKISMESILNKAHVQVYVQEFKIRGKPLATY